jgi:RNA polymerase sigma-70 factor (ECF subfamily)
MRDEEIIKLYFDRDGDAVARTQEKYGAYLYTVSYDLIRNEQDAEECVNDAYSAAWNSMPPNRPAVLRTYLCKLVRNITLKRIREQSAQKRGGGQVMLALDELEGLVPGQTEDREYAEALSRSVRDFVKGMQPDARRVFLQRYYYFTDIRTIAEKNGFTKSKVKMMLKRSRDALREKLASEDLM